LRAQLGKLKSALFRMVLVDGVDQRARPPEKIMPLLRIRGNFPAQNNCLSVLQAQQSGRDLVATEV